MKQILTAVLILSLLCACSGGTPPSPEAAPPQSQPAASPALSSESASPPSTPSESEQSEAAPPTGEVVITFDYVKQSGSASNQFAVWIEDEQGKLIRTLCATKFTADGGYSYRPDSIPIWVEKSGLSGMDKSEVDAVTSATPKPGTLTYAWNLADDDGNAVAAGRYSFVVEGTLRWKNSVLCRGVIEIGGEPAEAQAEAVFTFEGADNQPALSAEAPESAMIGPVTASYKP